MSLAQKTYRLKLLNLRRLDLEQQHLPFALREIHIPYSSATGAYP